MHKQPGRLKASHYAIRARKQKQQKNTFQIVQKEPEG
jgi:hypothetical protein